MVHEYLSNLELLRKIINYCVLLVLNVSDKILHISASCLSFSYKRHSVITCFTIRKTKFQQVLQIDSCLLGIGILATCVQYFFCL